MNRRDLARLAPVLALVAFSPALAEDFSPAEGATWTSIETLHGDADGFSDAFVLLREAMGTGDAATVAGLVAYPLTITANGEVYDVVNANDLLRDVDQLVTAETQALIAVQPYETLFVNADGVMFGDGEVWMAPVCVDAACAEADWAIYAINN